MGVEAKHETYKELEDQWGRCRDCSLGSDAVKAKGAKYLPLLDSHKDNYDKYKEYVMRAMFYNATGRTIAGLSGGIFQKTPTVDYNSDELKLQAKDITLADEAIDSFALNTTKEFLVTGRYGVLVDMSDEETTIPRPYWLGYKSEDIVNWRFTRYGGDQELSFVVLKECVDRADPKDEFETKRSERYRVLRLGTGTYTQQIYEEDTSQPSGSEKKFIGGSITTPNRKGKPLDYIPFVLPGVIISPPLIDLVDVNLAHYRGSADLKHGLHFTALPTPWVSGQGDTNKPLKIGSGTAWALDVNGRAGMLEFSGRGLGAIRTDLQDMQRMMATLGARLLEEAPHYAETALSVSMRHSSDYATLRTLAQMVEGQLSRALQIHAWWLGNEKLHTQIPVKVELNKVFYDQSITADQLRALLLALQGNAISYKTFYERLAYTGWTREGIDAEAELLEMKNQPPDAGKPTPTPGVPGTSKPGAPKGPGVVR